MKFGNIRQIFNKLKNVYTSIIGRFFQPRTFFTEIDPEKSLEAFLTLAKGSKILIVGKGIEVTFDKPLFSDPHPNIMDIQKDISCVIFGFVEASYVPGRLLQLLQRFDAFYAIQLFLNALNFGYGALLEKEKQRRNFHQVLDWLVDAEFYCKEAKVINELPLYKAIGSLMKKKRKTDTEIQPHESERIEECIERIHLAYQIAIFLHSHKVQSDFKNKAVDFINNWEKKKEKDTAKLRIAFQRIKDQSTGDLAGRRTKSNESVEQEFEQKIQQALDVLDLTYSDDLNYSSVRTAFRKKARKYRQDMEGDIEEFKRLRDAYDELRSYFERNNHR